MTTFDTLTAARDLEDAGKCPIGTSDLFPRDVERNLCHNGQLFISRFGRHAPLAQPSAGPPGAEKGGAKPGPN